MFIRESLDYDPTTGLMVWRTRPRDHFSSSRSWRCFNAKHAGKVAGKKERRGYVTVSLTYQMVVYRIKAHHLAAVLLGLEWPDGYSIDHINGNTSDNSATNLRACTLQQNSLNRKKYRNNTTGRTGVYRSGNVWTAAIQANNENHFLGRFANWEDAVAAREKAEELYFGEFARTGEPGEHARRPSAPERESAGRC